jgi:hypothetical protein
MPSLQGHKFINRERPRSHLTPSFSVGSFPLPANPNHKDLLPMLLSRGFEAFPPEQRAVDTRQWHALNPLLQRAESRPRTTDPPTAAHRRSLSAAGSLERAGSKQLGSRQSTVQLGSRQSTVQLGSRQSLYGEAGGEAGGTPPDAAIEERLRQKLGQRLC